MAKGQDDTIHVRYRGNREPEEPLWSDQYRPHKQWHRFKTFTREFPHKPDAADREQSPATRTGFDQDGGRFPLPMYGKTQVLWLDENWRTLSPEEREQMLCIPIGFTKELGSDRARNSALGNGFHIRTMGLLVWIVIRKTAPALLHDRVFHERGQTRPNPSRHRDPVRIAKVIATGEQPTGSTTKPLVQPGCGPKRFLEAALKAKHPAEEPPKLPNTLREAIQWHIENVDTITQQREQKMEHIRTIAKRLEPERALWLAELHPDIQKVLANIHLPLLSWLCSQSDLPDKEYMRSLLQGRNVLGPIQTTDVWAKQPSRATLPLQD